MGTHGTTLRTNTGMANRVVVWLRNDLRIHDNELFHRAKQLMTKGTLPAGGVVFFYAFDPRHFGTTEWGSRKTGLFRAKFLIETVSDLQQNLRKLGSDLIVRYGKPERLIGEVLTVGAPKQPTGGQVWFQQETTSEELLVENGWQPQRQLLVLPALLYGAVPCITLTICLITTRRTCLDPSHPLKRNVSAISL